MGKNLKDLKKLVKAKLFDAVERKNDRELEVLSQLPSEKLLIPSELAQIPSEETGPQRLVLNFENYNEDVCIFDEFNPAKIRSLLTKLASITKYTNVTIYHSGLFRDTIYSDGNGDYQKLFNKLSRDVDKLYEIEIAGYGRFYGHIVENVYYFVAIDAVHRDTR